MAYQQTIWTGQWSFIIKSDLKLPMKQKTVMSELFFLKYGNLVLETYENGQAALRDGAVDHIAFDVEEIEEAYKFITGLGIKILTEITFLPFWQNGVKFFIAEGPNLERLEFAQYL